MDRPFFNFPVMKQLWAHLPTHTSPPSQFVGLRYLFLYSYYVHSVLLFVKVYPGSGPIAEERKGLSKTDIIAISVGCGGAILLIIFIILFILFHKKKGKNKTKYTTHYSKYHYFVVWSLANIFNSTLYMKLRQLCKMFFHIIEKLSYY